MPFTARNAAYLAANRGTLQDHELFVVGEFLGTKPRHLTHADYGPGYLTGVVVCDRDAATEMVGYAPSVTYDQFVARHGDPFELPVLDDDNPFVHALVSPHPKRSVMNDPTLAAAAAYLLARGVAVADTELEDTLGTQAVEAVLALLRNPAAQTQDYPAMSVTTVPVSIADTVLVITIQREDSGTYFECARVADEPMPTSTDGTRGLTAAELAEASHRLHESLEDTLEVGYLVEAHDAIIDLLRLRAGRVRDHYRRDLAGGVGTDEVPVSEFRRRMPVTSRLHDRIQTWEKGPGVSIVSVPEAFACFRALVAEAQRELQAALRGS